MMRKKKKKKKKKKRKNQRKLELKNIFERVWISCLIWLLHDFCDKSFHHALRNGFQFG